MKFTCVTCAITASLFGRCMKHKELDIFQAVWHRLKGHHVIRCWKVESSAWENFLELQKEETAGTVWVVFKHIEHEGDDYYAICRNENIAEKARTKLAAILGEVETHFEIKEIARDAVHPYGILCMDNSVDIE